MPFAKIHVLDGRYEEARPNRVSNAVQQGLISVVEFASAAALAAWHDHPEHRKAQQRGRDDFFREWEVINYALLRRYGRKP